MVIKKYKLFNKKFLAKTVTWKLIDGVVTFALCFLLTGELFISLNLAVLEVLVESVFYYLHEHVWDRTQWGEYKMENNLANLATIAGAAPMIGFLGTVIGMIVAFHEMASAGGNIDIEMLSKGIYTAMVTTVAGLVVGIIAYISYNLLVAKVEKVVFMLEATTTEFMDLLHNNQ